MASRYPTTKVLDYCYNPVRLVLDDHQVQYVPCGKCDGCKLHSANEWSMRLGSEIEDNLLAIFFTLTYDNHFLPTFRKVGKDRKDKLLFDDQSGEILNRLDNVFTCRHRHNWRFAGNRCTLRDEDFNGRSVYWKLPECFQGIDATNYNCDTLYFPYSSKRDFQLYLKLLRKDLYELNKKGFFGRILSKDEISFRYYSISEMGETLLRPHIHAVILPNNPQVADYLCYEGLYKSWQMCRKDLFQQHCHFCDSGCRVYITQYLTCGANLPSVYKDPRIKPWRLCSKGRAIGFNHFNEAQVCEDYSIGIDTYSKNISRLNERYILRYPKGLGNRLFPKCFEYRKKDFLGLYRVYSVLWHFGRNPRWKGSEYLVDRLSQTVNPADLQAAKTCLKICDLMSWHPFTYVYTLDMYWYKQSMAALKMWYDWQSSQNNVYKIIASYANFNEYKENLLGHTISFRKIRVLDLFVRGFGLSIDSVVWSDVDTFTSKVDPEYSSEVSDILTDMVKMPKFNEKFGFSPNSVY